MTHYPKEVVHFGHKVLKHDIGKYSYRGFQIVKTYPFEMFEILNWQKRGFQYFNLGSLRYCLDLIDKVLDIDSAPIHLPIEIVSINNKPI